MEQLKKNNMRTIETTVYNTKDLNLYPKLREKVLERYRYINVKDFDLNEYIDKYYYTEESGFQINKIFYSISYSQGDGAMFEGLLILNKKSKFLQKNIKDKKLLNLITENDLSLEFIFKHYGHYFHEKSYKCSVNFPSELNNIDFYQIEEYVQNDYENLCKEIYIDIMDIYEYLISDEQVIETLEINEFEFDINGKII